MTVMTESAQMCAKPNIEMYPPGMAKRVLMGIQELRRTIGEFTKAFEERKEHVVLTKRGKHIGVTVPMDWYREAAIKMKDPTEF
jgi:hypothetical protein